MFWLVGFWIWPYTGFYGLIGRFLKNVYILDSIFWLVDFLEWFYNIGYNVLIGLFLSTRTNNLLEKSFWYKNKYCIIDFFFYYGYSVIYFLYSQYTGSLCLNFFHLLARNPNLEKKNLFIQTNSLIIFTCLNPVLLFPGFGQVA